jgi:hypothetical protein
MRTTFARGSASALSAVPPPIAAAKAVPAAPLRKSRLVIIFSSIIQSLSGMQMNADDADQLIFRSLIPDGFVRNLV